MGETYRKQETVVNFDTTSRRGGGEVRVILKKRSLFLSHKCREYLLNNIFYQISDLASSPLITGDPDSREEKYKRRAPTDWFLRQAVAAAVIYQQANKFAQVVENYDETCRSKKTRSNGMGGCSPLGSPRSFHSCCSLLISGRVNSFIPKFISMRLLFAGVAPTTLFLTRWTTLILESVVQFRRDNNKQPRYLIRTSASFGGFWDFPEHHVVFCAGER